MKKIFMFLAVAGLMAFSAQNAFAQDENTEAAAAEQEAVAEPAAEEVDGEVDPFNVKSDVPLHQALKTKFIEGGAGFMTLVILCLILGIRNGYFIICYLLASGICSISHLCAYINTCMVGDDVLILGIL